MKPAPAETIPPARDGSTQPPRHHSFREPIAIVASDFVVTGGMDAANYGLARYLNQQGHPLHLVSHLVDGDLARLPGVTFHRTARPLKSNLLAVPFLDRAGRRVAKQVQFAGGNAIVNANCAFPAINWVHYVHAAYQARAATNFARRVKTSIAHKVFLRIERKSLRIAKLIIANSDRTRSDIHRHLNIDPARIRTVYYGCNPIFKPATAEQRTVSRTKLGWPLDRPIVIFIGALGDRRKGFDTVFNAWTALCRTANWDADLVIVGLGAELEKWKQRATDAQMGSRFKFLGFRRDVPEILQAVDALVAPTRYEAYGLGVQEALCCGLPAIVSRDAGVAERYPQSLASLLLDDCEDATALANHLTDWRSRMDEFRMAVGSFGTTLRQRSWDDMAAEIEHLIAEIPAL